MSGSRVRVVASVVLVVMIVGLVVMVGVMVRRVVSGSRVRVVASVDRVVMIVGLVVMVGVMVRRVVSGSRVRVVASVVLVVMIVDRVVMIVVRAGTIVVMTFLRTKRSVDAPRCLHARVLESTAKTNRLVTDQIVKSGWLMKVRYAGANSTAISVLDAMLPAVRHVVAANRTGRSFRRRLRCKNHWRARCDGQSAIADTSR